MAKASRSKNFVCSTPNTMEDNKKMLNIFRNKYQMDKRNYEDYEKLFLKVNQTDRSDSNETVRCSSSYWSSKNTENFTYGSIPGFKPGAWWGIRMDCSRDLVHSPFDADVQVGPSGVVSICTSNLNIKEDIDFGEYLTLTGEPYLENSQKIDPLIINYKNQVPLRLIRSYNLLNKYAPKTGYRYDGLYIVIGHWVGKSDSSIMYNKFALMRVNNGETVPWKQKSTHDVNINNETKFQMSWSRQCLSKSIDQCHKYSYCSDKSSKYLTNISKVSVAQKNIPDSTIVTRKEFKKVSNNVENVSKCKSKIQTNLDTHGEETRSTDISIRTDLYDSSHNLQDIKRTTATCCRTARISTYNSLHKNTTRHLSVLQHYKMKSGSYSMLRPKTSSTDNLTEKRSVYKDEKPLLTKQKSNNELKKSPKLNSKLKKQTENIINISKQDFASLSNSKHFPKALKIETDVLETSTDKVNKIIDNDSNEIQKIKVSGIECMIENSLKEKINVEKKDELESLKSLTPDKILNLIDKQKYHPMSKLLIGDIIGLMPQESVILKARNNVSYSVAKCNTDAESQNPDNSRRNVKSKINRQSGNRERINRKRHFYKSSIQKHTQKRMREITNLLIDAKIEPIKRGPRNRRLRCTNKVQSKKYNTLHAIINTRQRSKVTKVKRQTREIKHKMSNSKSNGNGIHLCSRTNNNNNNDKNNIDRMKYKDLETVITVKKCTKSSFNQVQTSTKISAEKSRCEKCLQYSCNNPYDKKPCMRDATTQCFSPYNSSTNTKGLFAKASMCNNNSSIHNLENRRTFVEVHLTSNDCTNFSSCKLCPIHVRVSHKQNDTYNGNAIHCIEECMDNASDKSKIDNSYKQELSAFSSINRTNDNARITDHKQIDFKPVRKHFSFNDKSICDDHEIHTSNDLKQSILRKRSKYTNTEDNIVMYLDKDLQCRDINGEDQLHIAKECTVPITDDSKESSIDHKNTIEEVHRHLLSEEDSDLPWHGWKQIVTDKRLYWIGW